MEEVAEEVRGIIAADAYAARIGAELVEIRPGWAKVAMRLDKEHLNFMGMVHGGVMFSLADVAFGAAANSFGTKAMALSVNVDFLAAPRVEGEMTAEVSLVARAGKMGCYDMEVKDAEGTLVARCRGWAYHTGRPLREEGGQEGERRE
ncbi:MAG: PaaI family thioesterase [Actinobacteria bacterium]|nr:PaaI family thioesterase [Actinomycetota bacterium]